MEEFNKIVKDAEEHKNIDISSRFYWRSPEDWAEEIRQEERERIFYERQELRKRKQMRYQQKRDNFIVSLPVRILGLLLLTVTITAIIASESHDATVALLTVPISIFLILCPGYKNWNIKQ